MDQGIVHIPDDFTVEVRGADGPHFRSLDLVGSNLVPRKSALETVLRVNGSGRTILDASEFDTILFMGARIRTAGFFEPHLHRMQQPSGFLSQQTLYQSATDWLVRKRFFKAAKAFSSNVKTKVVIAPTTFSIETLPELENSQYSGAWQASKDQRSILWGIMEAISNENGVDIFRQPEATVTMGCRTKKEYISYSQTGVPDMIHRSADYGALILNGVFGFPFQKG